MLGGIVAKAAPGYAEIGHEPRKYRRIFALANDLQRLVVTPEKLRRGHSDDEIHQ
jgi:hypothetical protein